MTPWRTGCLKRFGLGCIDDIMKSGMVIQRERERDSKKEGKGIKREKAHAVILPSFETDGALGRHSS